MSVQYSNVGNPVSQALGGLTQYLMIENQRLDAEQKEKKINLAAEQIAEGYQNLPPDATIGDIQKLQYQLIEDAAALGGLQENMPLLSSLYQGTMTTREMQKNERRDSALYDYVSRKYGLDGLDPNAGGEIAFKLADFRRTGQRDIAYTNEEGKSVLNVYNDDFSLASTMKTSDFGAQQGWDWKKKEMDYGFQQDISKLKFAHTLANPTPTATGPQLAGFDLYTNSQGAAGETLYKHHKNGGTYFYNKKTGLPEQYWGPIQKVTSQTGTKQIQDSLQAMQTNTDTFQPQRLGLVQTLANMPGGQAFLTQLTGGVLPKDKEGIISMGAVTGLDAALRDPKITQKLTEIYEDTNDEEGDAIAKVMQSYNTSLSNQTNVEEIIKSNIPDSPYAEHLISSEDYEKGSLFLNEVFGNKLPSSIDARVKKEMGKYMDMSAAGITESTFRTAGRKTQEQIIGFLAKYMKEVQ